MKFCILIVKQFTSLLAMNHAYYGVYGKYIYSYTVATRLILSHWKFAIDKPLLV